MIDIKSERELVAVALKLIGDLCVLTSGERRIAASQSRAVEPSLVKLTGGAIEAGEDPLGDAFTALRTRITRRVAGAIYTPKPIVESMVRWAQAEGAPARVVDAGAGSGRFLIAAGKQFRRAKLIAIELDPVASIMLRANLAVKGLSKRATVLVVDYRTANLGGSDGRTLFIGNPPYVRHHGIDEKWKRWYAAAAAEFGVVASMLAGLHLHFFVRTLQCAHQGDLGTFITSAEWLDVNYGSALRHLLADRLGGVALHVLEASVMPFANALTTGAITCFRVDSKPNTMRVRSVANVEALDSLSAGTPVPWRELRNVTRWSTVVRPVPRPPSGFIELGEICRVSRGQVTGGNSIWIAGKHSDQIPLRFLRPTVTRARELLNAGEALRESDRLRRVIDLPVDLSEMDRDDRRAVERFLKWAKTQGAADSYVAQHRRAWWSVLLYEPPPIMCTYMARRPPAFVRNLCGARHLNIAHGLYPREAVDERTVTALLTYLRDNVRLSSGRTYAGGLTKFEPKELERIPVPAIETLRHDSGAQMDQAATRQ